MKTEFRGQVSPVERCLGQRYLGRSWQKSFGWRKTGLLPDVAKRILIETYACSLEQELRAFAHRIRWFSKKAGCDRWIFCACSDDRSYAD